jgi:protein phosphatase PTC2/3
MLEPKIWQNSDKMQGLVSVWQKQQRSGEDRCAVAKINRFDYYAVFDGHGASRSRESHVVDYCCERLHRLLTIDLAEIDLNDETAVTQTIKTTFIRLDTALYNIGLLYGTTCTMVLVDSVARKIYQANLGDSRSIIIDHNYNVVSASKDHKPSDAGEVSRINAAGGFVVLNRVNGVLAVSRAFGDFGHKVCKGQDFDPASSCVSALPDVTVVPMSDHMTIILTSDAFYDLPNSRSEDVVAKYKELADSSRTLNEIVQDMGRWCMMNSDDDITVIVVEL